MKHLDLCNRILARQQVKIDELSSFIIEYCIDNGKKDAEKYLGTILQLIQSGHFNLIPAVKYYSQKNNKQFYTLFNKDGVVIKHWIQ